jgi:hypothetical protein
MTVLGSGRDVSGSGSSTLFFIGNLAVFSTSGAGSRVRSTLRVYVLGSVVYMAPDASRHDYTTLNRSFLNNYSVLVGRATRPEPACWRP